MTCKILLLNKICKKHNIELLYIFGSQIENGLKLLDNKVIKNNDPLTDIDIGVVFKSNLPDPSERYKLYSSIYNQMEDIFSPFPLDLIFLQENHSVFQANAICGKCLYYANIEFKEKYEENILTRAADFKPFLELYYQEFFEEVKYAGR
jgi:hypothetical protein